jgi:hypothetical protein
VIGRIQPGAGFGDDGGALFVHRHAAVSGTGT